MTNKKETYNRILGVMIEDPYWMYYAKYRKYLSDLEHPFQDKIDFIVTPTLSIPVDTIRRYRALAFYHRDPLKQLYPTEYAFAKQLYSDCAENNVRMINSPDALSKSGKSDQLELLRTAGFNVAHAFQFETFEDLREVPQNFYPLFIRNNYGHDSDNETVEGLFNDFEDIKNSYREKSFSRNPHLSGRVAIQWIDTASSTGIYRRYRAFVTLIDAVTGNLHISKDWYIHGANNLSELYEQKEKREDEIFTHKVYTPSEKEFFISINRALGLGFSAIDYTYDKSGNIVIWEVNPHPAFPAWVDSEPHRSKVTNLLSEYYASIISN